MSKGAGWRTGRKIAAGLPLLHVPPPYEEVREVPEGAALHPFSALVLRPRGDLDPASLATTIASLRRSHVMPVVVWSRPSGPGSRSFRRAEWIRKAGGEPLPAEEEPTGDRLRELLCVRSDLAGDWLGWLGLHRTLDVKVEAAVRTIIEHSAEHASVTGLLRDRSVPPRSARRWLRAAGLPPAGAWLRASRLLRALLRLQGDPALRTGDVARELGYADAHVLSNRMLAYFGTTASRGRNRLGLERRFHQFQLRYGP